MDTYHDEGHKFSPNSLTISGPVKLVGILKGKYALRSPNLEEAMLQVPRHHFLPVTEIENIYTDEPIVIRTSDGLATSSCSQPSVVAKMLELLNPAPGDKVLEIGCGTGWAAALIGYLVSPSGGVTTIDIASDVANEAILNLQRTGATNVEVVIGDGGLAYAPNAPYDCIVATVGIWDIPSPWLAQLRVGGKIVVPFWFNTLQFGALFQKMDDANTLILVGQCGQLGFMRLRGEFSGPDSYHYENDFRLDSEISDFESRQELMALLKLPMRRDPASRLWTKEDLHFFTEFLALTETHTVGIMDKKNRFGFSYGNGLYKESSLALLSPYVNDSILYPFIVFGGCSAMTELLSLNQKWEDLGRPCGLAAVHIVATPLGIKPLTRDSVGKRWMQYQASFKTPP